MNEPRDLEARVTALAGRIEEVADRTAINALGLQLNGRLTGVERQLDGHDL